MTQISLEISLKYENINKVYGIKRIIITIKKIWIKIINKNE